jgi:hypothetical protein
VGQSCLAYPGSRHVGIDIHKRHFTVAAVDEQQHELLSPQKVAVERFSAWAHKNLKPSDYVAIEATTNSWSGHDQLATLVNQVVVANTIKLKMIPSSSTKTDPQLICYPRFGYLHNRCGKFAASRNIVRDCRIKILLAKSERG